MGKIICSSFFLLVNVHFVIILSHDPPFFSPLMNSLWFIFFFLFQRLAFLLACLFVMITLQRSEARCKIISNFLFPIVDLGSVTNIWCCGRSTVLIFYPPNVLFPKYCLKIVFVFHIDALEGKEKSEQNVSSSWASALMPLIKTNKTKQI